MLTPEEIIKRLERKYQAVLRAWLVGENYFPIAFPVGKLSPNFPERRRQIDALRDRSSEITSQGYDLEWTRVNKRDLGKQTVPTSVHIADLDHYLTLIRKRTEFSDFVENIQKIRRRFPALEDWIQANPQAVIEYHGQWDDLLTVCDYFIKNPRPRVYIRELPIPVHTKFIEGHTAILRDLLHQLLAPDQINPEATSFNHRFGLKDAPTMIRMRLLEEQFDWQYGLRLDDLSLPADQMAYLLREHLKPRHVIVVENLINFLTLPSLANSVGIFGSGFAIHVLSAVDWLAHCDLIYWGDIDAHGFEILSDLRGIFPNVRSVMMDSETLEAHDQYVVVGKPARAARFEHLTVTEARLAQRIVTDNLRLEQEHIQQPYAVAALKQCLFG